MSLLLNGTFAQQLAAGTHGSPRTAKGALVPPPTVQHGSRVGYHVQVPFSILCYGTALIALLVSICNCSCRHACSSSLQGLHPQQQQAVEQRPHSNPCQSMN